MLSFGGACPSHGDAGNGQQHADPGHTRIVDFLLPIHQSRTEDEPEGQADQNAAKELLGQFQRECALRMVVEPFGSRGL